MTISDSNMAMMRLYAVTFVELPESLFFCHDLELVKRTINKTVRSVESCACTDDTKDFYLLLHGATRNGTIAIKVFAPCTVNFPDDDTKPALGEYEIYLHVPVRGAIRRIDHRPIDNPFKVSAVPVKEVKVGCVFDPESDKLYVATEKVMDEIVERLDGDEKFINARQYVDCAVDDTGRVHVRGSIDWQRRTIVNSDIGFLCYIYQKSETISIIAIGGSSGIQQVDQFVDRWRSFRRTTVAFVFDAKQRLFVATEEQMNKLAIDRRYVTPELVDTATKISCVVKGDKVLLRFDVAWIDKTITVDDLNACYIVDLPLDNVFVAYSNRVGDKVDQFTVEELTGAQ